MTSLSKYDSEYLVEHVKRSEGESDEDFRARVDSAAAEISSRDDMLVATRTLVQNVKTDVWSSVTMVELVYHKLKSV